ncbi:DUF1877 family protein [Streptomyces sp. H27-C3]|uniref:DUF1877 family protein n=1 Tax=Streptomyces sp. H27-C3 TaxID=3046305 RepID=UPI0024B9DE68|nr:DUF1877 family protein [Streptomyces sp. H27-C3]MDJ0464090.1 DUF1877 family protein [Streptomyces sp. H27-C3]
MTNPYFHLRSVSSSELSTDPDRLRTFFADDWKVVRSRCEAETETVLAEDYLDVHRLYVGARHPPATSAPETLLVLGGRPVPLPGEGLPPFVVLIPAQVSAAAAYLGAVSFETLWSAACEDLMAPHGLLFTEAELRSHFTLVHQRLTAFYTRTSDEGRAVVKWLLV